MPLIIHELPKREDKVITMGKKDESVADYYPPGATEPQVRPAHIPPPAPPEVKPELEPELEPETAEEAVVAEAESSQEQTEETKPKLKRGKLPDDFPHIETLREAGITTYAKVLALKGDYESIEGIGEVRGQDIDQALNE